MNIQDIINEIKISTSKGLQIEKQKGILSSTWLIYKKNCFYYYFDINQKIEFIDRYKYTENEILKEFENSFFEIELFIN